MAEALNSLFKAECIRNPVMRPKGGWKNVTDVEIAVAEYVDWFNHRRLHGEIGLVPPAEFETNHWASHHARALPSNTRPDRGWFQVTEPPRNPGRFKPHLGLGPSLDLLHGRYRSRGPRPRSHLTHKIVSRTPVHAS